jgi:hypothetical protein
MPATRGTGTKRSQSTRSRNQNTQGQTGNSAMLMLPSRAHWNTLKKALAPFEKAYDQQGGGSLLGGNTTRGTTGRGGNRRGGQTANQSQ